MATSYRICLSSPPDREKLVAEMFLGDVQWAEINQEQETLQVEFYPRPDGQLWRINLVDVTTVLDQARERLIGEESKR